MEADPKLKRIAEVFVNNLVPEGALSDRPFKVHPERLYENAEFMIKVAYGIGREDERESRFFARLRRFIKGGGS